MVAGVKAVSSAALSRSGGVDTRLAVKLGCLPDGKTFVDTVFVMCDVFVGSHHSPVELAQQLADSCLVQRHISCHQGILATRKYPYVLLPPALLPEEIMSFTPNLFQQTMPPYLLSSQPRGIAAPHPAGYSPYPKRLLFRAAPSLLFFPPCRDRE